jgi:tetratricopeptide (TPR) repeat protein
MLKPKKKLTRKEIKRDPFLETIFKIRQNLSENRTFYTRVVAVAVGIFIVGTLFVRNSNARKEEANAALGKAMVYIDLGDDDNSRLYLQDVIDEYPGTPAGNNARYYLAKVYFDQGDYESAKPLMETFVDKTGNDLLVGSAYQVLANIYQSEGDLDTAVKYQRKALKNANSSEEAAWASLALAKLEILKGDSEEARKRVTEVLDEWEENFDLKQYAQFVEGLLAAGGEPLN